jgi:hypothetical protein
MREEDQVTDRQSAITRPVVTLGPPWWRCENGNEFRCGRNKPLRCPLCGSTNIEMVIDVAPEFLRQGSCGTVKDQ